jgi:hypothetical protein
VYAFPNGCDDSPAHGITKVGAGPRLNPVDRCT